MKRTTTTILVDDEPLARQLLREYLEDFPEVRIIGECRNGRQAVKAINDQRPDIVFLDIRMPGMDGLEVLEHLTHMPRIIFSTAYGDHAVKAFELDAVDYLLKPYDRARFTRALHKALAGANEPGEGIDQILAVLQQTREPGAHPERIFVRTGRKIMPVRVADIIWIEAQKDYSLLHTASGAHLCNLSMNALEGRLDAAMFMRVHRSHIVARNAIDHLSSDGEGGYVATLKGGQNVRVGRSYAPRIREVVW
jgi:two-component system, LytTR family, response regulator